MGPKPFRCLDAWFSYPNVKDFVSKAWNGYSIHGWGAFVLKEKIKKLKDDLREWNRTEFGPIERRIEELRNELQRLDTMDDVFGLEESEVIRRKEISAEILLALNRKMSLEAQQARIRWLREGDMNSKFFHRVVTHRRKFNEIVGIQIDGEWVEDPAMV